MYLHIVLATIVLTLRSTTCLPSSSQYHQFFSGDCPHLEPMSNFDLDRFLGQWYVVESTQDNQFVCLREEFNVTKELNKNYIRQMRLRVHENNILDNELEHDSTEEATRKPTSILYASSTTPSTETTKRTEVNKQPENYEKVYHVKRTYLPFGQRQIIEEAGKIRFTSDASKADFEINFPYSETGMLNLKHYQVVTTDYERFALVWRCQKTIFGHRRQAQLMSRKASFLNDPKMLAEMRSLLKHFEAEHDVKFQSVRQHDCHSISLEQESSITSTANKKPTTNESNTDHQQQQKDKNKKKLINIDVGGFHLSISYPFW